MGRSWKGFTLVQGFELRFMVVNRMERVDWKGFWPFGLDLGFMFVNIWKGRRIIDKDRKGNGWIWKALKDKGFEICLGNWFCLAWDVHYKLARTNDL